MNNINDENSKTINSKANFSNIITSNLNTSTVTTTATKTISSTSTVCSPSFTTTIVASTLENKNQPSITAGKNKSAERTLERWDDRKLKELLDEAYSYKSPKDRENKSETFKQLLENAEKEREDTTFPFIPPRYTRSSNSRKHGGSLQDLVESVNNDLLMDYDTGGSNRNRRYHHSRPKKYSLVSSRQREGGSLPSNVNVSNCSLSIYEHPFMNEVNKYSGDQTKSERTCSGASYVSVNSQGHESVNSRDNDFLNISGGNNSGDTIIDIGESYSEARLYPAEDSVYMGSYSGSSDYDVIEQRKKFPRANINATFQGKLELSNPEDKSYVDDSISFSSLERCKNTTDSTCVSLIESYSSAKCDQAEVKAPPALFTTIKNIPKQYDENGNSLTSTYNTSITTSQSQAKAKKKKSQSERNTKTIVVTSVVGYRGQDPVEDLVKYIENTEDVEGNKKTEKSSKINNDNSNKKKDKKKEKDLKKLKKSNSLEELRSCAKLDEEEPHNKISMLTNKKQSNIKSNISSNNGSNVMPLSSNDTLAIKDNFSMSAALNPKQKRSERRSWGTEELTYLGENNVIEEVKEKIKEKEKKRSKELQANNNSNASNISLWNENYNKSDKADTKKYPISGCCNSDVMTLESAEFHVVTKKKKSKKRQNTDDVNRQTTTHNSYNKNYKDFNYQNNQQKKYQIDSNDSYLRSFEDNRKKKKKSRRKSTSSMPPSEKSDSSDLESVHSLPIESTSNRNFGNSTAKPKNNNSNAAKSYADMARSKLSSVVSNGTPQNTAINDKTKSIEPAAKSTSKRLLINKDFPNLLIANNLDGNTSSSSCNSAALKQISYSQSLTKAANETQSLAGNKSNDQISDDPLLNKNLKQILQKSKSVDNENYLTSMDQYPALEKTVKRHAATQVISVEQQFVAPSKQLESKIVVNSLINDIKSNSSSNNPLMLQNSNNGKKIMKNISTTTNLCSQSLNENNKTGGGSIIYRKIKRDNKTSQQNPNTLNKNYLPAVIMLNEPDLDLNQTNLMNEFTFGDFKEEELQFYNEDNSNFDINNISKNNVTTNNNIFSLSKNINNIKPNEDSILNDEFCFGNLGNIDNTINADVATINNCVNLNSTENTIYNMNSPRSDDYGYSSAVSTMNNRSHLSEDLEISSKLSSTIEELNDNQNIEITNYNNNSAYLGNINNNNNINNDDLNTNLNYHNNTKDDNANSTIITATSITTTTNNLNNNNNNINVNDNLNINYNNNNNKNNDNINNNNNNNNINHSNINLNMNAIINNNNLHYISNNDIDNNATNINTFIHSNDKSKVKANVNENNQEHSNSKQPKLSFTLSKSLINATSLKENPSSLDSKNNDSINSVDPNAAAFNTLENTKKIRKHFNVRFIPPNVLQELNAKVVEFVGSAWQEIINGDTAVQFYDGK